MSAENPPWDSSVAGCADGGGDLRALWANHGKPWDAKAMGTKASHPVEGAMLARLLDILVNHPKGWGTKPGAYGALRYGSPAAGYFASVVLQRKEII